MEEYNKFIAENPKVALIHVSQDHAKESAEKWASKVGMPWLTVLPDNVKRSKLMQFYTSDYVPFMTLIDKNGKQIATDSAVFEKAAELTGYTKN